MKFTLLDYSEVFYNTISKTLVPAERGGKFVQIRNESTEYLVLSPKELSSFHANILERFCLLQGLKGEYATKRMDKYEITDTAWEIIGGGKWFVNEHRKWLHLFNESGVYRKFDPAGLKERILLSVKFERYEVKITA